MNEWEVIELASRIFTPERGEVVSGAGEDDCAVIKTGEKFMVLTADALRESTDFPPQMEEWEKGHMSLAVNLSDVAAMGAEPAYFLYTVSIPEKYRPQDFEEFCMGIERLARRFGVDVVGGDTDGGEELQVSGFAVGFTVKPLMRKGARAGERVYLTGLTGKAQLSLEQLFSGMSREEIAYPSELYTPEPRVREGIEISEFASSCTDISDSLAISLHLISRASGVRIELSSELIELDHLTEFVDEDKAMELFLYAGGDFELVYTCESGDNGFEIGRVVEGSGVYIDGRAVEFRGYQHF